MLKTKQKTTKQYNNETNININFFLRDCMNENLMDLESQRNLLQVLNITEKQKKSLGKMQRKIFQENAKIKQLK